MQEIFDLLDASAKDYPIKALADEIGKAESTLRNELNRQPGYKFGLETFDFVLRYTKDLSPLIKLNRRHNLLAFEIPQCTRNNTQVMEALSACLREFGEHVQASADAMKDGELSGDEKKRLHREAQDVIDAMLRFKGCLDATEVGGQRSEVRK